MEIKAFGDHALLINLEQSMEPGINQQILELDKAIHNKNIAGLLYTIPAYSSLTVAFDPGEIEIEEMKKAIAGIVPSERKSEHTTQSWKLPVCYDKEYALDMEALTGSLALSQEEIISMHTSVTYRVYMLGFIPGFLYLGNLEKRLNCPRRESPRISVPAGSVGITGLQTGIYPASVPGGWQIIGRSPVKTFFPEADDPFPIKPGDFLNFEQIRKEEFEQISREVISGEWDHLSLRQP